MIFSRVMFLTEGEERPCQGSELNEWYLANLVIRMDPRLGTFSVIKNRYGKCDHRNPETFPLDDLADFLFSIDGWPPDAWPPTL